MTVPYTDQLMQIMTQIDGGKMACRSGDGVTAFLAFENVRELANQMGLILASKMERIEELVAELVAERTKSEGLQDQIDEFRDSSVH